MDGQLQYLDETVKRRRVERACETCRRRKERCNGSQPSCSNCLNSGRTCSYSTQPRKRGLPEGWVRSLEKVWALTILRHPQVEADVLSTLQEGLNRRDGDFAAIWTDEASEEGLLSRWKTSRLSQQLEKLLPRFESLPPRKIQVVSPLVDTSPHGVATYVSVQQQPHFLLPPNALQAIQEYFTWIHPWLPILDRTSIYESYGQWLGDSRAVGSEKKACILAIVAIHHARQSPSDGVHRLPSSSSSEELCLQARTLIPTYYRDSGLGHIQALLLVSLAYFGINLWDDGWVLLGQAIRLAILERTVTPQHSQAVTDPQDTRASGLRLALIGLFISDTLISAVAGLPSHFRADDIGHVGSPSTASTDAPTFEKSLAAVKLLNRIAPKPRTVAPPKAELESIGHDLREARMSFNQRPAGPVSPWELTPEIILLTVSMIRNNHARALQSDVEGLKADLHESLRQLETLLTEHASALEPRAVPLLWQPIFGIILNEFVKAKRVVDVQFPPGLARLLDKITTSAETIWPCFRTFFERLPTINSDTNHSLQST